MAARTRQHLLLAEAVSDRLQLSETNQHGEFERLWAFVEVISMLNAPNLPDSSCEDCIAQSLQAVKGRPVPHSVECRQRLRNGGHVRKRAKYL